MDMEPKLVGIMQAAHLIGVGRTSCYDMIREGRLKTAKLGRRRLVTMESVRAVIEKAIADAEAADERR